MEAEEAELQAAFRYGMLTLRMLVNPLLYNVGALGFTFPLCV